MSDHDAPMGAGPHPEDALSAYVDGDLAPAERAQVREHLLSCPSCRAQVEQLQVVREVVRTLPFVDPPVGFYERTLRLGPRPRSTSGRRFTLTVTGAVLGLLGLLLVVAVVGYRREHVKPPVTSLVQRVPATAPLPARAAVGAPAGLPSTLPGGYVLASVSWDGDHPYAVYSDGAHGLVVTWTNGAVQTQDLPAQPAPVPVIVDGDHGWLMPRDDVVLLVLERGARVYTLAAPVAGQDLVVAASALPETSTNPSVGERVEASGRALLEAFGLEN